MARDEGMSYGDAFGSAVNARQKVRKRKNARNEGGMSYGKAFGSAVASRKNSKGGAKSGAKKVVTTKTAPKKSFVAPSKGKGTPSNRPMLGKGTSYTWSEGSPSKYSRTADANDASKRRISGTTRARGKY